MTKRISPAGLKGIDLARCVYWTSRGGPTNRFFATLSSYTGQGALFPLGTQGEGIPHASSKSGQRASEGNNLPPQLYNVNSWHA